MTVPAASARGNRIRLMSRSGRVSIKSDSTSVESDYSKYGLSSKPLRSQGGRVFFLFFKGTQRGIFPWAVEMNRIPFMKIHALPVLILGLTLASFGISGRAPQSARIPADAVPEGPEGFRVWKVPNVTEGAECYFSPDGQSLIYNGKEDGDPSHRVYTIRLDGTNRKRINDRGADACSFWNPNGEGMIWTSTRDHLDMKAGNFSDVRDYPQGAEIYVSDLDGRNVVRMTDNKVYDAEVTYAPDGHKILFGRQIEGRMDLWTMDPDGRNQKQITFTPEWQEGGALYMPDSKTIITRAWKRSDENLASKPMHLFLLNEDGSNMRQVTKGEETHWSPFPCPDGVHAVYVKLLPPRNFEIFLIDLETGEEKRLTYNDGFDGFPSISPDGKTLAVSSSRGAKPGVRTLSLFLMDISSLGLGRNAPSGTKN
jgi:TolB protein